MVWILHKSDKYQGQYIRRHLKSIYKKMKLLWAFIAAVFADPDPADQVGHEISKTGKIAFIIVWMYLQG